MTITHAIIPVSRFSQAKTRLSPTLTPSERENLLKAMLIDVVGALKPVVGDVVVVSSDVAVLKFVEDLGVTCLPEKGDTDLNGALSQALNWCSQKADQVIIVPSDVPLIKKGHVEELIKLSQHWKVIIAPAKGGGTNTLLCPTHGIGMRFGDCSFFRHQKEAQKKGLTCYVYDSFYISLDVNTSEDLGEIMIHGQGTATQKYLQNIGLEVHPNHGRERLRVEREK